jgi:hypothetical protein
MSAPVAATSHSTSGPTDDDLSRRGAERRARRAVVFRPLPQRRWRSDEALARWAAQGDDDAFAALYARYGRRLEAYCRSILRNDEDARDAVQSAMTNAYLALGRSRRDVVVRPWLLRIAHNEANASARRSSCARSRG